MWKKPIRTYVIAASLCALSMVCLMGFVPKGDSSFVRRPVSFTVEKAHVQPLTATSSGSVWVGRVSDTVRTLPCAQYGTAPESIIVFADDGVALAMANGLKLIEDDVRTSGLLPLLAADMGAIVNAQGLTLEALTDAGLPLRFSAAGQGNACAVSPALFAQLTAPNAPTVLTPLPRQKFDSGSNFANAKRYESLVHRFAARFSLDPALVYAIIHAESSFRPLLVSSRSAMGLMQLLPSTAGGEVSKFLHGSTTRISLEELGNPEVNIHYGTAYLYLLMNRHMAGITNALSRQYCAVAAYNMGPNGLLRLFGSTRDEAIAAINAMTPEELLRHLTTTLPVRETRHFVAKVTHAQENFANFVAESLQR